MKKRVFFPVATLFLLALVASFTVHAQQMYKWTDKDGVIHFSETPPADQQAESTEIPAGPPPMGQEQITQDGIDGSVSAAQQRRDEISQNHQQAQANAAQREAQCAAMRAEVARLEPNRRVFYTDDQGETVRMDDQVRVEKVAAARKFIEQNCN